MDTPGFKNIHDPHFPLRYVTNDNICQIKKALAEFCKCFNICAAHASSIPKERNLWVKYFAKYKHKKEQE